MFTNSIKTASTYKMFTTSLPTKYLIQVVIGGDVAPATVTVSTCQFKPIWIGYTIMKTTTTTTTTTTTKAN